MDNQTCVCIVLIQDNEKKFNEVCSCKTVENSEMYANYFFQHSYYGFMFTSLLLHYL